MYTGQRDPEIPIVVPMAHCHEYESRTGETYIEVFIPPEHYNDYNNAWGSIMLKPTQVFFIPNSSCNQLMVNDEANIVNSVKDPNRKILDSETLTPKQIIGRTLKFWMKSSCEMSGFAPKPEFTKNEKPSIHYYNEYEKSGMNLYRYICNMFNM